MHEERGQSWVALFVFGILIFAALGAFLFYKFEDQGFYDRKNQTNLNQTGGLSNVNRSITNTNSSSGCFLSWVRWEKDNSEVSTVKSEDSIVLATYAERCSGKLIDVKVYKENGNSDIFISSFSSVISGNSAQLSMTLDSNFVNGSTYYFVSSLVGNASSRVESSGLLISNLFTPGNNKDPLLCDGYGDDRDYLYNVNVNVFTKSNGRQSFIATLDGKTLRTNVTGEDRFFVDNSNGALQINYDINHVCGGFDITYNINNPTSQPQLLPDFIFGGFKQARNNPNYLELKRGGMLASAAGITSLYGQYYPSSFVYSPLTLAVTDEFSQGTSIQYPFLSYKVETILQMNWATDGSMTHRYVLVYPSASGPVKGFIPAGTQQTYVISLRFAPSRYWLLTLEPYKKYFLSQYGGVQKTSKDTRPVAGVSEAYTSYVNATNPRGYVDWYTRGKRLDIDGWADEVTRVINLLNTKGYKRLMLWQTAGLYDSAVCANCNFPPAFMDWLPKLVETQSELNRIKQAGISLGFWWGRSGQIPVPDQWPPSSLVLANYSNTAHHSYLLNQFNLAKQRGADSIGLDTFTAIEPNGRSLWLDEMKSLSSIEFVHEHGGADIFHTRAANFYTDNYENGNWDTIFGPSILSWYLNPNSEVWAYAVASNAELNSLGQSGMQARAQQLAKWGYTYVDNGVFTDVKNLDLTISECLDRIDNDGDGVIDWPRDNDCQDEFDESER